MHCKPQIPGMCHSVTNDGAWGRRSHGRRHGNAKSGWLTHPPHARKFPRSDTMAGQKRRQPGNPGARGGWSWDNMRSRVRPPQACVHSGPVARTPKVTGPGGKKPTSAFSHHRAATVQHQMQTHYATSRNGYTPQAALGSSTRILSFDWAPRGKRGQSLHAFSNSELNGKKLFTAGKDTGRARRDR